MTIFKDISDFNNISNYLHILNAAILIDMIGIFIFSKRIILSKSLETWYTKFHIFAIIADVLIICLGLIASRFLYYYIFNKFSIVNFTILTVLLQITHDVCFYLLFNTIPSGHNNMIDIFKEYAKSAGVSAVWGDSIMMIGTCLVASFLANYNINTNIIVLIVLLYCITFIENGFYKPL